MPEFDYTRLAEFLKRVTPGILEALDETYGSNAFEDYNPETTSESFSAVHCLAKLNTLENPDLKVIILIYFLLWTDKRRLIKNFILD